MNADLVLSIALVASFAALITSHCALAFGLIARRTVQREGWLLLLPVTAWLAPYWGYRAGLRVRTAIWTVSLVVYVVSLAISLGTDHTSDLEASDSGAMNDAPVRAGPRDVEV
jgi:hypothetical protein